MKKKNIIMDLDTGIDDAVALVFGATLNKLQLNLVSTVFGNVELKKVVKNTLIILEDINRTDIKVVVGSEFSNDNGDYHVSAHGKNGLGNYTHTTKIRASKENYIKAIHNEVQKNDMTYIICCGPLTNLANFIDAHPEDNDKICVIVVTGLLEIDKENPYLNFNIQKDIDSCEKVLKSYKNIVIVPSDMGHISYIPRADFEKTAKCGRVGKILAGMYPHHMDRTVKDGAAMHDLCGVLWLSHPKLFKTVNCHAKIIHSLKGSYLDFDLSSSNPNVLLAVEVNKKKLHKLYYKTLKSLK